MQEGKKVVGTFPLSHGKNHLKVVLLFLQKIEIVKIVKITFYVKNCKLKTKQVKEFEANLNELKRKPPNEKGQMLAYYIEEKNI